MPTSKLTMTCIRLSSVPFTVAMLLGHSQLLAQSASEAKSTERVVNVVTVELQQTDTFEMKRQFSGQIEARRRSLLGFDRIGQVTEVYVDRGDEVSAGQLIAALDVDSLRAQRHKLEADLRSAEALLREAKAGPLPRHD